MYRERHCVHGFDNARYLVAGDTIAPLRAQDRLSDFGIKRRRHHPVVLDQSLPYVGRTLFEKQPDND